MKQRPKNFIITKGNSDYAKLYYNERIKFKEKYRTVEACIKDARLFRSFSEEVTKGSIQLHTQGLLKIEEQKEAQELEQAFSKGYSKLLRLQSINNKKRGTNGYYNSDTKKDSGKCTFTASGYPKNYTTYFKARYNFPTTELGSASTVK